MQTGRGLDFIAASAAEPTLDGAIDVFREATRYFGFACCAAGGWSGVGAGRVHRFYFNDWPAEWLAIYEENAMFPRDPMVLEARRRLAPFLLSEEEGAMRRAGAGDAIDACYAFGWTDVYAAPFHGPGGYQALVTLAALGPLVLDATDRAVLAALAGAIHQRCHAAIGFGRRSKPAPVLTERQLDCMRWVAVGKTDAEIGVILGLAAATAHYHVEKAKKTLGVSNRAEAAALLVLDGIL